MKKTLISPLRAGLLALTAVLLGAVLLSSRAKSAGGPVPVSVTNPSASPVPTQDADSRQPFQTVIPITQENVAGQFTVPAGKALVIQTLSANVFDAQSSSVTLSLRTTAGGTTVTHWAGALAPDGAGDFYLPLTAATLHADPGSVVSFYAARSSPVPPNTGYGTYVVVSGYLVSAP